MIILHLPTSRTAPRLDGWGLSCSHFKGITYGNSVTTADTSQTCSRRALVWQWISITWFLLSIKFKPLFLNWTTQWYQQVLTIWDESTWCNNLYLSFLGVVCNGAMETRSLEWRIALLRLACLTDESGFGGSQENTLRRDQRRESQPGNISIWPHKLEKNVQQFP